MRSALPESTQGEVGAVTTSFAPAISLLYGSWLGLTFSILEERIGELQRTATQESAELKALVERVSLLLDRAGEHSYRSNANCFFMPLFEQTTTLASRSREEELIVISNNDVYYRFRRGLIQLSGQLGNQDDTGWLQAEITNCYNLVDQLVAVRADRLSKETKSLPSAHFVILSVFSVQLLGVFVYSVAQSPAALDDPVLRVAFSLFVGVYVLVLGFANDLNDPFRGHYQIRRSAINANLLATRRLIASVVGEDTARRWQKNNV